MKGERAPCWSAAMQSGDATTAPTVKMWLYAVREEEIPMILLQFLKSQVTFRTTSGVL